MKKIEQHPTYRSYIQKKESMAGESPAGVINKQFIIDICMEEGTDDAGVIELGSIGDEKEHKDILEHYPWAKSVIGFVCKMNRQSVRSTARSVANLEFHNTGDRVNHIASRVVTRLEDMGFRALNPSMGFPMEMDRFPGKIWIISHKKVAVQAGLGKMGIHRNVIHPKFGNFILLGSIITDINFDQYSKPIDYNPCLDCKLCVAACPVGAIGSDGHFSFSACYTHNYREFMGGFTDWVETIADSKNGIEYRKHVNDSESSSMWQSLSFGANYKAAYCMSVCPAGEDVIGPFIEHRTTYLNQVVKPFQEKKETVYVTKGSDGEEYVQKRFKNKITKVVKSGIRPVTVEGFLQGLPLLFQRNRSKGLNAVYHFRFTGKEEKDATVKIHSGKVEVSKGTKDKPDLVITADSDTWIKFIRGEKNIVLALLSRKIKLKGPLKLLKEFGKCFPG